MTLPKSAVCSIKHQKCPCAKYIRSIHRLTFLIKSSNAKVACSSVPLSLFLSFSLSLFSFSTYNYVCYSIIETMLCLNKISQILKPATKSAFIWNRQNKSSKFTAVIINWNLIRNEHILRSSMIKELWSIIKVMISYND